MALVVSSALVDAGYAAPLWRLVAARGRVRAIVAAPDERWFADAAVNAVVVVVERGAPMGPTAVARLRVPTDEAAAQLDAARGAADPVDRLGRVAAVRAGADPDDWPALLRAPDAWFSFRAAAAARLVPLGELVEVRRGVTSGANEVFYLPRARAAVRWAKTIGGPSARGLRTSTLATSSSSPPGARSVSWSPDDPRTHRS